VTNALSAPASRAAGRPSPPLDRARCAALQARSSRANCFAAVAEGFGLALAAVASLRSSLISFAAPTTLSSPSARPKQSDTRQIFFRNCGQFFLNTSRDIASVFWTFTSRRIRLHGTQAIQTESE